MVCLFLLIIIPPSGCVRFRGGASLYLNLSVCHHLACEDDIRTTPPLLHVHVFMHFYFDGEVVVKKQKQSNNPGVVVL